MTAAEREKLAAAVAVAEAEEVAAAAARLAVAMRDAMENGHSAIGDDEEEDEEDKEKEHEDRRVVDDIRAPLLFGGDHHHQRYNINNNSCEIEEDVSPHTAVGVLDAHMHHLSTNSLSAGESDARGDSIPEQHDHHHDRHPLRWPHSLGPGLLHAAMFPLLLAWYLTIPSGAALHRWYFTTMISSSAWLAIMAFGMTYCLEQLAAAWSVPPEIMGLTLGAAGGVRIHNLTPFIHTPLDSLYPHTTRQPY